MVKLSDEQLHDARRMASEADLPNFSKAGTGKTHTALEAMALTNLQRHLVIAPKIALHWWAIEAHNHLGADARVMSSGNQSPAGEVLVTTYDIAANTKNKLYEYFDGGTLTLDESHYVANPATKRAQAVFGPYAKNGDLSGSLVERFDYVWPMSGTPMMNYADDYYTQAALLHPELFSPLGIDDYRSFCRAFTVSKQRQYNPKMRPTWKIVANTNEAKLRQLIYKDLNAIRREEAPGLPRLTIRDLPVTCSVPKEYKDASSDMTDDEMLRQLTNPDSVVAKAWKVAGLAKVDGLVPYVGDSARSSPVLLGCHHHDVMDEYDDGLRKIGLVVEMVSGKTPTGQREEIRKRFNNGEIDVLIGQMKAMGVSWNLQQACSHVVVAEEYPSPSVIEQFYKRVYRRGQEKSCTVDIVTGRGVKVEEALAVVRKRKEASNVRIG